VNRRQRRLVLVSVALGVLGGSGVLGWAVGAGRLGGDRSEIVRKIDLYRNVLLTVREERTERPALDERLAMPSLRVSGVPACLRSAPQ
jgi:hypothetical protein